MAMALVPAVLTLHVSPCSFSVAVDTTKQFCGWRAQITLAYISRPATGTPLTERRTDQEWIPGRSQASPPQSGQAEEAGDAGVTLRRLRPPPTDCDESQDQQHEGAGKEDAVFGNLEGPVVAAGLPLEERSRASTATRNAARYRSPCRRRDGYTL